MTCLKTNLAATFFVLYWNITADPDVEDIVPRNPGAALPCFSGTPSASSPREDGLGHSDPCLP